MRTRELPSLSLSDCEIEKAFNRVNLNLKDGWEFPSISGFKRNLRRSVIKKHGYYCKGLGGNYTIHEKDKYIAIAKIKK